MAEAFIAEIRIFPFNFAPRNWAQCDGQILPISQNTALFSLIGTNYGGNGTTNFALPNLDGNAPMFWGQGPGLSNHNIGENAGVTTVTLLSADTPAHNHTLGCTPAPALVKTPGTGVSLGRAANAPNAYSSTATPNAAMDMRSVGPAGGSIPHNNMMPFLALNFCICLQGIFPSRP